MNALKPNMLTLRYAGQGDPEDLERWDEERWIVPFATDDTILEDDWAEYPLEDGRVALARRADCGAGCRCAGEFVMLRPAGPLR